MSEIMGDQLWQDNIFFAIRPDPATAVSISRLAYRLRDKLKLRGRPLAPSRLHISLHGLGQYVGLPAGVVRQAIDAANLIVQEPFEVEFDRILSFPEAHALVLHPAEGLDDLNSLYQSLGLALAKFGLRKLRPTFTPHVTLLYDEQFAKGMHIEPVRWIVRDFVLIHSYVGRTRHETLGRWQLNG